VEEIRLTEQIASEKVLTMIGDERDLIDTIWKRQRKWIGHACRLRGVLLLRTAIQRKMDGKNTRNNLLSLSFCN